MTSGWSQTWSRVWSAAWGVVHTVVSGDHLVKYVITQPPGSTPDRDAK